MSVLARRDWVPDLSEDLVQKIANQTAEQSSGEVDDRLQELIDENRNIHEK